jgi:hypothetical protein
MGEQRCVDVLGPIGSQAVFEGGQQRVRRRRQIGEKQQRNEERRSSPVRAHRARAWPHSSFLAKSSLNRRSDSANPSSVNITDFVLVAGSQMNPFRTAGSRTGVRQAADLFRRSRGPLPQVHSAQRRENGLRSLQEMTDLGENFFSRNELGGAVLDFFEATLDLFRPSRFDVFV